MQSAFRFIVAGPILLESSEPDVHGAHPCWIFGRAILWEVCEADVGYISSQVNGIGGIFVFKLFISVDKLNIFLDGALFSSRISGFGVFSASCMGLSMAAKIGIF